MAIFTQYGNPCTIIKREFSGIMEYDEQLTVRRVEDGAELQYLALELKADAGIKEIAEAVEVLQ
jgi:hypothetical protein